MSNWSLVIGLEIHVQLKTQTKLFSRSPTLYGQTANTQCNEIDLGLPGALPVPNKKALELAIAFGLITQATIPSITQFDRKNYFYPDLPKGYQITQNYHPIVIGGKIDIVDKNNNPKTIRIHHAHLEEDAGKSIHAGKNSSVDLNRAGVTLLEIVSEPDMRDAHEVLEYLKKVHQLVRYFNISDANMQEGSFRADVNISVRPNDDEPMRTRAEIKNVNSFKFIEKAIAYEYERQVDLYKNGESVIQETRKFNEQTQKTESLRGKENAEDYRYFPDPDLPVIKISEHFVENIRKNLGETPSEKKNRLITTHDLSEYDASVITQDRCTADIFDQLIGLNIQPKLAANWLMVNVQSLLNKHQLQWSDLPFSAEQFATLLRSIQDEVISGNQGKEVLEIIWNEPQDPMVIIEKNNMAQITDKDTIYKLIHEVMAENPNQVEQYIQGQDKLLGFFIGILMKKSAGKINPTLAKEYMMAALKYDC